MNTFIDFKEAGTHEKQPVFHILNKSSGQVIGRMFWYKPWKKYVFESDREIVWDEKCLGSVRSALVQQTLLRKK